MNFITLLWLLIYDTHRLPSKIVQEAENNSQFVHIGFYTYIVDPWSVKSSQVKSKTFEFLV